MNKLIYYIERENDNYEPFLEYSIPTSMVADEAITRQLCTYHILKGRLYELKANEITGDVEELTLKDLGENPKQANEKSYDATQGIPVEFRKMINPDVEGDHLNSFLTVQKFETHWDVLRYLTKDYVEIPAFGKMQVTSTEIDEDRSCYVINVRE